MAEGSKSALALRLRRALVRRFRTLADRCEAPAARRARLLAEAARIRAEGNSPLAHLATIWKEPAPGASERERQK